MSKRVSYSFDTEIQKLSFIALAKRLSLKELKKIMVAKKSYLTTAESMLMTARNNYNQEANTPNANIISLQPFKDQVLISESNVKNISNEITKLETQIKNIESKISDIEFQIKELRTKENE
ncbi:hypothetical protein OF377_02740 [Ureaplasma sp. ES3154-GEN]|uniref:hypothetical protein n=1 Tax=Ureaplasma sp. ES3154-GEN TaxID=2984844 RepID=UPI0021E85D76|nr:hypothetical protein [Ureaplasma sp. ES3154-GEN]MCV3743780.1 hypothetical protein [Ureaplasma sp. ES3154-GEN]